MRLSANPENKGHDHVLRCSKFKQVCLFLAVMFLSQVSRVHAKDIECVYAVGDSFVLGLILPLGGSYNLDGVDQQRAAELAIDELNSKGGVLGRRFSLCIADSSTEAEIAKQAARALLEEGGARALFGGGSSASALEVGRVALAHQQLYFATLAYAPDLTSKYWNKYFFRECPDSRMNAGALGNYLNEKYSKGRYFYLYADYSWGQQTVQLMREQTGTENTTLHPQVGVGFPRLEANDLSQALLKIREADPDVLILALFGEQMVEAVKLLKAEGIRAQLVVPVITSNMAAGVGAEAMEGVIGAVSWDWQVPFEFNYLRGKRFVLSYRQRFGKNPSSSAASMYAAIYEYARALERAGTTDSDDVVSALEGDKFRFHVVEPPVGHEYTLLKDRQVWRALDHQSLQTVYVVRGKPGDQVSSSPLGDDYFKVISSLTWSRLDKSQE